MDVSSSGNPPLKFICGTGYFLNQLYCKSQELLYILGGNNDYGDEINV